MLDVIASKSSKTTFKRNTTVSGSKKHLTIGQTRANKKPEFWILTTGYNEYKTVKLLTNYEMLSVFTAIPLRPLSKKQLTRFTIESKLQSCLRMENLTISKDGMLLPGPSTSGQE